MTLPYDRKFKVGRGSEQLYGEELHKIYESVKHLTDTPDENSEPVAKLHRSMWHKESTNELKYWDNNSKKWINYYDNKFKIIENILSALPPENPVAGELWIYNGVLCYFDGTTWQPVKALLEDGSQFSLDLFKNFLIASPINQIGGTIVEDDEIEAFKTAYRQYIQGVLDGETDSTVTGDGSKWDSKHECILKEHELPVFAPDSYKQMLVPNINYARVFLDHVLDRDKYKEVSPICIQYHRNDIVNSVPTLIHLNPGRLTKVTKTIVKIDRANPQILIPPVDTEYYGFRGGEYYGDLLIPDSDKELQDYTLVPGGIHLNYNASQNYDYVLAIHYDFTWFKTTGRCERISNRDASTSYYINDYAAPINVFVEGYDLEGAYFDEAPESQTITIKDDSASLEVSMLHTPKREYGFVRQIDVNDRGILHPLRRYTKPLVFINGEAIHPVFGDMDVDTNKNLIYIPGAKQDMMWSVVELHDENFDYEPLVLADKVPDDNLIHFNSGDLLEKESVVLFIDGLLVKKEDVIIDYDNCTVDVDGSGLTAGQEYILVEDKFNWLYDEEDLIAALPVGSVSESLVYVNGHLICNDEAVDTYDMEGNLFPVHNEVKCFRELGVNEDGEDTIISEAYKVYNSSDDTWEEVTDIEAERIAYFARAYKNMPRSVRLNLPISKNEDDVQIYAFSFANAVEHPLIIKNVNVYDEKVIDLNGMSYLYGKNTLRVWCNGVRIYPDTAEYPGIKESLDGMSFELPEKFTGQVTYVIELPEDQKETSGEWEMLDHRNLKPGYINMYTTKKPLFPGRVTVYINGIRMPKEAFTIYDNYTILINGDTQLIGNANNYPTETRKIGADTYTLNHNMSDVILIEVRQDDREEKTFELNHHPVYEILTSAYDLPPQILEPNDEIMVFINGLYFGPRLHDGYEVYKSRGAISFNQDTMVEILNSDELDITLNAEPELKNKYLVRYGKDYSRPSNTLMLEWR